MIVTRKVQVDADTFDDLAEALSWVIRYHDREFEDCPAFTILIEKNQRNPPRQRPSAHDEWESFFSATISGVFEYDDMEDVEDSDEGAKKVTEKE